jgi:hemerythrin superfamily protein
MEIKSILNGIVTDIYSAQTVKEAKELFIKFVDATKIKDTDKKKMLMEVERMITLRQIQQYTTNAMFKYEGLGIK